MKATFLDDETDISLKNNDISFETTHLDPGQPPQPDFKRIGRSLDREPKQENPSKLRAPDNGTPRKLNRMFPTISLTQTQKRPTCEIVSM